VSGKKVGIKKKNGFTAYAMTLNDNKIVYYIHWDDVNEIVDLWLLEARPRVRQVTIITRFRWFSKSFAKSDYKLISFYTLCHLVDITMLINKFGLSLGGGSESHYQWRRLLRNYMRDNALCIVAVDFDTKSCKIRRVALPMDDADAANKRYVQQSVQNLKDRLNEIRGRL